MVITAIKEKLRKYKKTTITQNSKRSSERKAISSLVLYSLSFLLLALARGSTGFAEWYSNTVYPVIVNVIGRIYSVFPFSIAELYLYILLLGGLISTIIFIIQLIRKKRSKKDCVSELLKLLHATAILVLIYTLGCGINYHRVSFSERSGIKTYLYSSEDLAILCEKITADVNHWGAEVTRSKEVRTDSMITKEAVKSMKALGTTYEMLNGYYPKPKGLLIPEFLSIQGLSGIYSPFTIEANYNNAMTSYNIPFTMTHELSHLRGFMQEEEANFIAYLACKSSDSAFFQYSGSLMAWIYSMNVLHKVDQPAYERIRSSLIPEASADLEINSKYWDRYEGKISETTDKVNDTYLKANGQAEGVKSYDRMVDLLVAYELDDNKILVQK